MTNRAVVEAAPEQQYVKTLVSMTPSDKEAVQKLAKEVGIPVNSLIRIMIRTYLSNKSPLKLYPASGISTPPQPRGDD